MQKSEWKLEFDKRLQRYCLQMGIIIQTIRGKKLERTLMTTPIKIDNNYYLHFSVTFGKSQKLNLEKKIWIHILKNTS